MRREWNKCGRRFWNLAILVFYTAFFYTGFLHLHATDICLNCHVNAICTINNGTKACNCNFGFSGNGITICSDKDECQFGSGKICGLHAACNNTHGSYYCTCNEGYKPSNNMSSFIPNDGTHCTAIDCGTPPVLQNTLRYPPVNTNYGNIVRYQCAHGYKNVTGNTSLICSILGHWEGQHLECEVINCGSPPVLENTVQLPSENTTYGSTVTYKCLTGYVYSEGNTTLVCSAQGQWEGLKLECKAADCGSPPDLQNTVYSMPENTTYGSTVKYQCLTGHRRVRGNDSIVCSSQGRWQGLNLECEAVDCGSPPELQNTVPFSLSNTTYGSTVQYQCLAGHVHVGGNSTLTCSAQGQWEGPSLQCEAVDCGSPPAIANTLRSPPPNTTYGSTAVYQCLPGFDHVAGNSTLVCSARGSWEGPGMSCQVVDCGSPPSLENTRQSPLGNTTYGSKTDYTCLAGYVYVRGNTSLVCSAQGQWEGAKLECEAVDCGPLAPIPNAWSLPVRETTYGTEVQYHCRPGFVREGGNGTMICSETGQWEGARFNCSAVDCGPLAPIPNAWSLPVRETTYGTEVQYHCRPGFVREGGNGTMICSETGQWEGARFNCSAVDCGPLAPIPNAWSLPVRETTYGTEVQYHCRPGFVREEGNGTMICSETGQWEGARFNCSAVDCGPLAPIPNAWSPPVRETTYGTEVQYHCRPGFVREGGNGTMICSETGQWEGARFNCSAVDCGPPAPIPNAWSPPVRETTYGTEVQYHCRPGFVREGGNGTMICSETGQWEGARFNCSEIDCGIPPAVPHAKIASYRNTRLGSVAHYRCRDGFYAVSGSNMSICKQEGQWEEITLVCQVNEFTLYDESCLKWKRDGVGTRSEDTYLFQIQGERVYQREFFYKISFNYSTADDSPAICLDLQPGTNYTVNITALTSQHSACIQLSMAVTDPPVPNTQVLVVEQVLPPLILRRVESKNGPISLYQVVVLPLNMQHSFNCNSQNTRDFFGHQKGMEAYITAEFIAMDVKDGMLFSVGDRLYYRGFYNAVLEAGKNYSFLLKIISEWNYVKKQSCVTLAQLKGSSNNAQTMTVLGLGSLGTVGFILFLCYSVVWGFKTRQ